MSIKKRQKISALHAGSAMQLDSVGASGALLCVGMSGQICVVVSMWRAPMSFLDLLRCCRVEYDLRKFKLGFNDKCKCCQAWE